MTGAVGRRHARAQRAVGAVGGGAAGEMHAGAGSVVNRINPYQGGDPVVGIDPAADMAGCGGAVPFAPLGSGGGGSTASGAALAGMTGAVGRRRAGAHRTVGAAR